MTSVRDDSAVPPQRPAGPRCHCGTAITHTRGKRPRVYCSDACKKRAKRAIARGLPQPPATGEATSAPAKRDGRLGTTARTTDMQVSGLHSTGETGNPDTGTAKRDARYSGTDAGAPMPSDIDTATRDARFELRDALRAVSGLDRLRKCGLSVLAGGVTPVLRNGRAGYAGVVTCGSVHVCPCCSTSIRRVRQDELDQVGEFWECQSCGLVMMTLTMRHYERQSLALLEEQQRAAWKCGFGMNAGRRWRDAKRSFGVRGFVRAWEVTHGPNGWHAHYHVLLFLHRPLATARVEELQHLAFEVWSAALQNVGAYLPTETSADGKPVGVKIDAPDRGEAGQLARYLMKNQDGKTSWGVAAELTRQDVKQGQGGHRTPFEIARDAIRPDADPRDVALWREFEATATGVRSLYWSNGLRALLREMGFELDERNDADVAAEDAKAGAPLACIPGETWYRHIARHKGRALALLKAAERFGADGVRTLIESWGLIWGVDVLEPEDLEQGELPTAAEVMRRQARARMVARANTWRRGFAQLDMKAAAERFDANPDAPEYRRRAERFKAAAEKLDAEQAGLFSGRAYDAVTAARNEFLHRRTVTRPRRAADVDAALARFRDPDQPMPRMKVSLRKQPTAPPPAPVIPPPFGAASPTCRRCGGRLAPVLQPHGRHPGDCLKADPPLSPRPPSVGDREDTLRR